MPSASLQLGCVLDKPPPPRHLAHPQSIQVRMPVKVVARAQIDPSRTTVPWDRLSRDTSQHIRLRPDEIDAEER